MGIFNTDDKQSAPQTGTTVISDGTFIRGGIETIGDVFCDGKFEGAISANSLTIGKSGEIIGNVTVKTLNVSGVVDGIINADDVNILESGRVIGKLQYTHLAIDKNGVFEGEGKLKNSTNTSQYQSLAEPQFQELIEEA